MWKVKETGNSGFCRSQEHHPRSVSRREKSKEQQRHCRGPSSSQALGRGLKPEGYIYIDTYPHSCPLGDSSPDLSLTRGTLLFLTTFLSIFTVSPSNNGRNAQKIIQKKVPSQAVQSMIFAAYTPKTPTIIRKQYLNEEQNWHKETALQTQTAASTTHSCTVCRRQGSTICLAVSTAGY